jgi:hypothetical protein
MPSDKKKIFFRYDDAIWENIKKLKTLFKTDSFNKVVVKLILFHLEKLPIINETLEETKIELKETQQREIELIEKLNEIKTFLAEKKAAEERLDLFLAEK